MKLEKKSAKELEVLLNEVTQELYQREQQLRPLPPWILVRVLPKSQEYKGILLPDTAQNKPVYEGIVVATWASYMEYRWMNKGTVNILHECAVNLGDRICFPSHEGMPVTYLDDKYYRLVRDGVDQNHYPYMGVYGTLHYDEDQGTREALKDLFQKVEARTISGFGKEKP